MPPTRIHPAVGHTPRHPRRWARRALALMAAGSALGALAACATETSDPSPTRVTLMTYDSFPAADTSLNEALAAFSERTGIEVTLLAAGDTGTMISKAVLTSGNPEGDVIWGVDQTFVTQAVEGQVFAPLPELSGIDQIDPQLRSVGPTDLVVPVNFGDVCINYDISWYATRGIPVPTSLADLTDPLYADQLVVQNPATSSPGLAMLLATVATFGEEGWIEWWESMAANGMRVTNGWTEAYYEQSTWAGGGDYPMVVSYGSSPPAEVVFADPPRSDAPTAVIESSCFRQVEFAGILRGTSAPEAARALLEFLISEDFQRELALNLFVFPAHMEVELPEVFLAHAVIPAEPLQVDPALITQRRSDWIEEWTARVLR